MIKAILAYRQRRKSDGEESDDFKIPWNSRRAIQNFNAYGHQSPKSESLHKIILFLFCWHNSPFVLIPTSKQMLEECSLLWLPDDPSFCIFYSRKHVVSLFTYLPSSDGCEKSSRCSHMMGTHLLPFSSSSHPSFDDIISPRLFLQGIYRLDSL